MRAGCVDRASAIDLGGLHIDAQSGRSAQEIVAPHDV